MKTPRLLPVLFIVASIIFGQACQKTLVIKNVDYAQHIESVLEPNEEGIVTDVRHGISFSVLPFQAQEFEMDTTQTIEEIRLIRNSNGFYFITASNFRHVYVMSPREGELRLEKKILVNEEGIENPAFNWRSPLIELVSMGSEEHHFITEEGIIKPQEEEKS